MSIDQMIEMALCVIGCLALLLFNDMKRTIEKMSDSIESLNQKMAVICERVDSHEKRIDRLEKP